MAEGRTVSGALLEGAIEIDAVCTNPEESSVTWISAVCAGESARTRTRIRAVPVPSDVVVPDTPRVSVLPAGEVMIRTSPETTSKRTGRPTNGTPFWVRVTFTSASPPEHTELPHAADWLALGVTVTTLLTVRGFTVSEAVAGV